MVATGPLKATPGQRRALCMAHGPHKSRVLVGVRFHARALRVLVMAGLFVAAYGMLVLSTTALKMHDARIKVVVRILIEVASNSR